MSNNSGDAATTARDQETEQTQTPNIEQPAQDAQSVLSEQPTGNVPAASAERQAESAQPTGTHDQTEHEQTSGADHQAQAAPSSEASVQGSAFPATPQPTGDADEGVANSANVGATTAAQEATRKEFEPRPDVSDQGFQQLLPKLLAHFNNNREQLARAIGLHRSTVDRWLNGKSRPNNSTVLRMRRFAQERNIE